MQIASDLILAAVVTVAAVTDLRSGRIRNGLVYPAIVVGMLLGFLDGLIEGGLAGGAAGLEDHALAAGVAFAVMLFCYAIGGMGGGDVKLMAAVGALGGWSRPDHGNFILYAMVYAFVVGVILGLLAALWKRALGHTAARTWWGVRMLAVPGTSLDEAVPKGTVKVPFGFATAVGTVWLLVENYSGLSLGMLVERLLPA